MPLSRKRNLVMLLAVKLLVLGLFLPGCQEGTNKSPVSALFVDSSLTGAQNDFSKMENANHSIYGTVTWLSNPVENVSVALYYGEQLAATTRTSTGDGKFVFTGLPEGLFDVIAMPDSNYYESKNYVIRIVGEDQSPSNPIEIPLSKKF